MGIRLPGFESGDRCAVFPDPDNTPAFMYIQFWELEACPGRVLPPNGETFKIGQHDAQHCFWENGGGVTPWYAWVRLHDGPAAIEVSLTLGPLSYHYAHVPGAIMEYDCIASGQVACGPFIAATGGYAVIWWLKIAEQQALDMGYPLDGDGLFLESFFTFPGIYVNKFCNTTYSLNQKIKFTP